MYEFSNHRCSQPLDPVRDWRREGRQTKALARLTAATRIAGRLAVLLLLALPWYAGGTSANELLAQGRRVAEVPTVLGSDLPEIVTRENAEEGEPPVWIALDLLLAAPEDEFTSTKRMLSLIQHGLADASQEGCQLAEPEMHMLPEDRAFHLDLETTLSRARGIVLVEVLSELPGMRFGSEPGTLLGVQVLRSTIPGLVGKLLGVYYPAIDTTIDGGRLCLRDAGVPPLPVPGQRLVVSVSSLSVSPVESVILNWRRLNLIALHDNSIATFRWYGSGVDERVSKMRGAEFLAWLETEKGVVW